MSIRWGGVPAHAVSTLSKRSCASCWRRTCVGLRLRRWPTDTRSIRTSPRRYSCRQANTKHRAARCALPLLPGSQGRATEGSLSLFVGVLQADAYAGFDRLYGERIQEAACWAHARRKFYEIHVALASPIAAEALDRIGRLYKIEAEIRGKSAEERRAERKAREGPQLKSLHEWLQATVTTLSRKSQLALAIRYALSHWVALTRYLDDGRLEIDNNAAERALRAVALGRKNWLFAGSDDGGERAAAIYTIIGTAKLNDIDPEAYLRHVLERVAEHPINRIDELLPWTVASQLDALKRAA